MVTTVDLDWDVSTRMIPGAEALEIELLQSPFLRKEVIQPQVLLQLPCYDFTPIADHTMDSCPPCGLAHRLPVQPTFVM